MSGGTRAVFVLEPEEDNKALKAPMSLDKR